MALSKIASTLRTRSTSARSMAIVAAGSLGALLLLTTEAQAETTLAVDVSRTDGEALNDSGAGIELTLGSRTERGWFARSSELIVGYQDFGPREDADVTKILIGARFGYDGVLRPSLFSRAGIGYLSIDAPVGRSEKGVQFAGQTGLALDVQITQHLEVGLQASYNWAKVSDSFDWWQTGIRATVVLDP